MEITSGDIGRPPLWRIDVKTSRVFSSCTKDFINKLHGTVKAELDNRTEIGKKVKIRMLQEEIT